MKPSITIGRLLVCVLPANLLDNANASEDRAWDTTPPDTKLPVKTEAMRCVGVWVQHVNSTIEVIWDRKAAGGVQLTV
jgi:hypothetical protein